MKQFLIGFKMCYLICDCCHFITIMLQSHKISEVADQTHIKKATTETVLERKKNTEEKSLTSFLNSFHLSNKPFLCV